jgi:hypothetical protein
VYCVNSNNIQQSKCSAADFFRARRFSCDKTKWSSTYEYSTDETFAPQRYPVNQSINQSIDGGQRTGSQKHCTTAVNITKPQLGRHKDEIIFLDEQSDIALCSELWSTCTLKSYACLPQMLCRSDHCSQFFRLPLSVGQIS